MKFHLATFMSFLTLFYSDSCIGIILVEVQIINSQLPCPLAGSSAVTQRVGIDFNESSTVDENLILKM